MQKILFILTFKILLASALHGQDIYQVKAFSDELLKEGNFNQALMEYQRVLFFDTNNEFRELYAVIASIYYQLSDYGNALKYYDYAVKVEKNDSIKIELTLKKALCDFRQDKYLEALTELYDLPVIADEFLESKKNLYLGITYFGMNSMEDSRKYFSSILDSTGIHQMNDLLESYSRFIKRYNPEKVEWMSRIIPGSGQIYTGNILSGLNSFVLLSGIASYAVITAINYGIIDGIMIFSSWFFRYYSGGYHNASDFAHRKFTDKKTEVYSELLSIIGNHQKYGNN